MRTKKLYSVLMMAALVAMSFTACSEDVEPEKTTLEHSKMTCFGSGEVVTPAVVASVDGSNDGPSFLNGLKKIAMAANGKFTWVEGDMVWVKKENEWFKSVDMDIKSDANWADFYFDDAYDAPTYEIRYTGTSEDPNTVTITSKQVQKAGNNSEHYAACGDAAWGIAKKLEALKYRFNFKEADIEDVHYDGNHEASYIYFEPRTDIAPSTDYCRVRKVTITEKNGKNICGTYNFSDASEYKLSDETRTTDGGSVITLYCGEDVEKVDDGLLSPAVAEHNGFPIKEVKDPTKNRVFLVMQPGTYELQIDYEVAVYLTQTTSHDETAELWTPDYVETYTTVTKNIGEFTYLPNTYYSMGHKLNISNPESIFTFPFKEYYMWGATDWFWKGAETQGISYPVHNDEYQTDGAPTDGSSSWFNKAYSFKTKAEGGVTVSSFADDYHMYINRDQVGVAGKDPIKAKFRDGWRRDQLTGDWDNVLNANEMTYYIVFGDPYYDNKTPWILEEYNGGGTVCYGGVWLLKKDKIIATTMKAYNDTCKTTRKLTWPSHNDAPLYYTSDPTLGDCLSAPYPTDALEYFPGLDEDSRSFIELKMMNQQWNLRYMAPPYNFRKKYTNDGKIATCWRPDMDGKDINDYFFVPCLGRFEYDNVQTAVKTGFAYPYITYDGGNIVDQEGTMPATIIEGTGQPTLTLVGSQGYYWTKTPLMFNYFGQGGTLHEMFGTRFYKYAYDKDGNFLSEYSNLDKFTFAPAINQRYAELRDKKDKGTLTTEEEAELNTLQNTYRFNDYTHHGGGYTNNALRNLFRFANYGTWNDNAFYLNIHYDYIGLSWQQHSIYVKTGMRKATRDIFQ